MRRNLKRVSPREIRHWRLRKRVMGTGERPRLSLYPSLLHLEAQFIDDYAQKTLLGFTTKAEAFQKLTGLKRAQNVQAAVVFGKFVAEKAKAKGIQSAVFDRAGFLYHGRVRAFADAVREGGVHF